MDEPHPASFTPKPTKVQPTSAGMTLKNPVSPHSAHVRRHTRSTPSFSSGLVLGSLMAMIALLLSLYTIFLR
jgi:hypothetical protein